MKTKYVNAGIKSKAELAKRLADGDTFYLNGGESRFYFDANFIRPFRALHASKPSSSTSIGAGWEMYEGMCIKKEMEWWEDIPKQGVLCWVKDNLNQRPLLRCIIKYDGSKHLRYFTNSQQGWVYAKPLTNEEIRAFLQEE